MDRAQHPEIETLDDFHITLPVREALPNGIPLTIIGAGEQEVIRVDILFAGGRWHQSLRLQAFFTNRMLREGTRRYTSSDIAEKLDYYGSWLELSGSADYGYLTVYSLNKYLAETLEIVESMVKEAAFPEKELQIIVSNNLQQYLINASKVDFLAQRALLRALYGVGHPCGNIVEREDYNAINREVLLDFYKQYYHSGNCHIFLSGKVTDETIRCVTDTFGTPFGQYEQLVTLGQYPIIASPDKRIVIEREDALQSAVKIGCTTITRKHADFSKLQVLLTLFGGYFGSRLMSNIREEKGYTYGISAGILSFPDSGVLEISAETDNRYVELLIQEVYNEIEKLHQDLVSSKELDMVRNYMLGEMCRNYESPFSLADAWITAFTCGLDEQYFSHALTVVKNITAREIQELAQQYLCKETLKEVVAGKKLS